MSTRSISVCLFVRPYLCLYGHVYVDQCVDSLWGLGTKKVPLIHDGWGKKRGKETGGVIEKEFF